MDVLDQLKALFEEFFGKPIAGFGADTSADDVEDWDSTSHVSLILLVEEHFNIEFTTAELAELDNVGALRDIIVRKAAQVA